MGAQAKREYLQAIYTRYWQAKREEKQGMLDECRLVTGYHRKYVVRRLNRPAPSANVDLAAARRPMARPSSTRSRDLGNRGYPWSVRLKALLPLWLPWGASA